MTFELPDSHSRPLILHCFADFGTESEVLAGFGNVLRVGTDIRDSNDSTAIQANAYNLPFAEDVRFDLGFFHPVCKKWADTTSISGDPDDHPNQIPQARAIGERYCDHYVIENKPQAPLKNPVILEGGMFGLPIAYKRGFETTFPVPQPPRYKSLNGGTRAETSPFFYSERSRTWWASVKGYQWDRYPKQHLAKNSVPAPYVHHICRAWLSIYEKGIDRTQRPDYSDYDAVMDKRRREEVNEQLSQYMTDSKESNR